MFFLHIFHDFDAGCTNWGGRMPRRRGLLPECDTVGLAELLHLGREVLPAPEPPQGILGRKTPGLRPIFQEFVPSRGIFGMYLFKSLCFALEHGRAEVAADPLEPEVIQGVDGYVLPPQIEVYLERPPVPDRRDIQLERVGRVLAGDRQVCPVPGLVPPVSLDRDTGPYPGKVEFKGVQFQEFAAPPPVFCRRPGLLHCTPEIPAPAYNRDSLGLHECNGLGEFDTGIDEESLCYPGFPGERENRSAVFSARERDVYRRAVMQVLTDRTNRVSLEVL
ncbi:MAG: hypothetical protein A4E40_00824 [Methanoregulaceae archaeon PtaU1.Bin059]|nr:MAG: hypothetical protein A4E40_00824 [Methanoregulaceae archaeon PtaU1.Bin059]